MIRFTNTIEIRRLPEQVFAYLSDLEHTPEWNWAITETTKTSQGPVGVGTTYRQTRSVPRPATETLEITAFEPGELLELDGELASLPAHLTYRLHPSGDATTLENTVVLGPGGASGLLARAAGKRIEHAVGENLGALKERLEGQRSD